MTIAIKFLVLTVLFGIISQIFPASIITTIGIPTAGISSFVAGIADMISNFCTLGDVFLDSGATLLMFRAVVLFVFIYAQFRIFYPIFKLIAY